MRIVWRFLIIALGLVSSIIIARIIGVEALASYSLYVIVSLLVAEVAHMAVDQPMVRVLRSGERNLAFWLNDVLIGAGVVLVASSALTMANEALDIVPLLANVLATYLLKCLYPVWIADGARDRALLLREGGITVFRFVGVAIYIALASAWIESADMMTVVGLVYLLCVLVMFVHRVQKMSLRLEAWQMGSAALFHFSYVRLYIASAPVTVFNALVAMRLGAAGASEILAAFHVLSRFFSPVNIFSIMQISRFNLDLLDRLGAGLSVRPHLRAIIQKNVMVFLAVTAVITLSSDQLLAIWNLEQVGQSLLVLPLATIALGVAISGPWLIISDYFGHASASSLLGLVVCILLGLGYLGFSTYSAFITFGAIVLFSDRLIKLGFVLTLTKPRPGDVDRQ
jgi:hypothetical protein